MSEPTRPDKKRESERIFGRRPGIRLDTLLGPEEIRAIGSFGLNHTGPDIWELDISTTDV